MYTLFLLIDFYFFYYYYFFFTDFEIFKQIFSRAFFQTQILNFLLNFENLYKNSSDENIYLFL